MNTLAAFGPELVVAMAVLLQVALPLGIRDPQREALTAARLAVVAGPFAAAVSVFWGVAPDGYGLAAGVLVPLAGSLLLLPAAVPGRGRAPWPAELPLLALTLVLGGLLAARATHGGILLLGIETMALCGTAMAGIVRGDRRALAAALRLVLLGAVVTALAGLGWALLGGVRGHLGLEPVSEAVVAGMGLMWVPALVLVGVGLLFKIGAAPFHVWSPDFLSGTPLDRTAFLAVVPKLAGILALAHLVAVFSPSVGSMALFFDLLAVLSVLVGGAGALTTSDARRLLAFSSVVQSGWMMLLVGRSDDPRTGTILVFTLAAWGLATVLAFWSLQALCPRGRTTLADLGCATGLSRARWTLVVSCASLIGLPPLAGLLAKWWTLGSVLGGNPGLSPALLIGLLALGSVPLAASYFRLVRAVRPMAPTDSSVPPGLTWGMLLSLMLLVLMGFGWPWIGWFGSWFR